MEFDEIRKELTRLTMDKDFKEPDCIILRPDCVFCQRKETKFYDMEWGVPAPICATCYQRLLTKMILEDIRTDDTKISKVDSKEME